MGPPNDLQVEREEAEALVGLRRSRAAAAGVNANKVGASLASLQISNDSQLDTLDTLMHDPGRRHKSLLASRAASLHVRRGMPKTSVAP